jgi:hypothetical protein
MNTSLVMIKTNVLMRSVINSWDVSHLQSAVMIDQFVPLTDAILIPVALTTKSPVMMTINVQLIPVILSMVANTSLLPVIPVQLVLLMLVILTSDVLLIK